MGEYLRGADTGGIVDQADHRDIEVGRYPACAGAGFRNGLGQVQRAGTARRGRRGRADRQSRVQPNLRGGWLNKRSRTGAARQ